MPLHTHGGESVLNGSLADNFLLPGGMSIFFTEVTWFGHRPLWYLICSGVLDRHPNLKLVFTEQFSDWWIEPIDFFRLRYATLSYRIPPNFLRGMQNATLTLAGRNLFYSSDYSGLDPESADQQDSQVGRREYYVLPQLRSFTIALRVGW